MALVDEYPKRSLGFVSLRIRLLENSTENEVVNPAIESLDTNQFAGDVGAGFLEYIWQLICLIT